MSRMVERSAEYAKTLQGMSDHELSDAAPTIASEYLSLLEEAQKLVRAREMLWINWLELSEELNPGITDIGILERWV